MSATAPLASDFHKEEPPPYYPPNYPPNYPQNYPPNPYVAQQPQLQYQPPMSSYPGQQVPVQVVHVETPGLRGGCPNCHVSIQTSTVYRF